MPRHRVRIDAAEPIVGISTIHQDQTDTLDALKINRSTSTFDGADVRPSIAVSHLCGRVFENPAANLIQLDALE